MYNKINEKKILMVTAWPPFPIESGGQITTSNFVKFYLIHGYKIELICLVDKKELKRVKKCREYNNENIKTYFILIDLHFYENKIAHYLYAIKSIILLKPYYEVKFLRKQF